MLAVASTPGCCKVLARFPEDLHIRILSTANVPQQMRDWCLQEMLSSTERLGFLSPETLNLILDLVDSPILLQEAQHLRDELMAVMKKCHFKVDYKQCWLS